MAGRLTSTGLRYGWFGTNQASCVPGRSNPDIIKASVHDVEVSWSHNLNAATILVDVRGAYDSVDLGTLREELRRRGVPPSYANGHMICVLAVRQPPDGAQT